MQLDTIVAVATAPTAGAVGIVRLSGPQSWAILEALSGLRPAVREARLAHLRDASGQTIDQALVLGFKAPASYTGEDAVELHGHGNPLLLEKLCRRCVELGARRARPGEFSQRAFENGKLDLAQAEAVADLITAASEDAAQAAQASLQGVFSQRCEALAEDTLMLRSEVEAWLDFPEEDLGQMQLHSWAKRLQGLQKQLQTLLLEAEQGVRLNQGMEVLIVGAPNAGKSTLLNALARREVAIVSDIQGTTRDLVSEQVVLNGVPLRLTDSAGLRDSDDPIEQLGIARMQQAAQKVDRILALDAADAPLPALPEEWTPRLLRVRNKADVDGSSSGWQEDVLHVSAKTGAGLDLLAASLSGRQPHQTAFSARQRHLDALRAAASHLEASARPLSQSQTLDLAAEELRLAQSAMGEVTGSVSSEDLLGRIFSSFCIGK